MKFGGTPNRKKREQKLSLFFDVNIDMIKDTQLDLALAALPSYTIAAYDGRSGRYRLTGKSEEHIILRHDKSTELLRLDALIHFEAEYLNLYSYSQLVNIAHDHDCCVTAPAPHPKEVGHTQVRISATCPYSLSTEEIEYDLLRFSNAIGSVRQYFLAFLESCQLDKVDISMFHGLSLEPARLLYMAEQKEIRYGTWDNFIENVYNADTPDTVKELVLPYLDACKRFEEANPTLKLAEIAVQLTDLVEEHSQTIPDAMDIN